MERFLQTLAAAIYAINVMMYGLIFFFILYITFFTKYWLLLPISVFWTWYDRETPNKGGRPLQIVRGFPILRYFRGYFPMRLVKTVDLEPDKNYIFGSHPHGVLCASTFGNFLISYSQSEALFPGLKFYSAAIDFNFQYPMLRELALAWGLISTSKRSLKYHLNDRSKGNVVILAIGGANEIPYVTSGHYRIILKKRKGFVKIALSTGCCLVPVIHFGENDIYELVTPTPGSLMHKVSELVKKYTGLHSGLPVGRSGLLKFLPKRMPITTVVGRPIEVPKVDEPTPEQVAHFHAVYTEELIKLFDEHKHKYVKNPENTHLVIVE